MLKIFNLSYMFAALLFYLGYVNDYAVATQTFVVSFQESGRWSTNEWGKYNGKIPNNINKLVQLPGVGRKTANVVLGNVFNTPALVVDTHVTRISNLLGFVQTKDAVKIEMKLMKIVEEDDWTIFSHLLIDHGRAVCIANRPNCKECIISDNCPSSKILN